MFVEAQVVLSESRVSLLVHPIHAAAVVVSLVADPMIEVPSVGVNRTAPALSFRSLIATFTTGLIPHAQWPSILLCGRLHLTSRPDSWFGTASKGPPTGGRDKKRWSGDPSGGGGNNVGGEIVPLGNTTDTI